MMGMSGRNSQTPLHGSARFDPLLRFCNEATINLGGNDWTILHVAHYHLRQFGDDGQHLVRQHRRYFVHSAAGQNDGDVLAAGLLERS